MNTSATASATTATTATSTGNPTLEEEIYYCHELARRSVARAALHLGLKDGMSQDALDVLADVLLQYLQKIGKTTSHLVESSGRPSSHANALDAMQAIHMTTAAAAVLQVHVKEETTNSTTSTEQGDEQTTTAITPVTNNNNNKTTTTTTTAAPPWNDLAVFCFGPKWLQEESSTSGNKRRSVGGVGGKVGPSAGGAVEQEQQAGWVAPYLEEVPSFPMTTTKRSLGRAALLHMSDDTIIDVMNGDDDDGDDKNADNNELDELNKIPDKVFTEWGSVGAATAGNNDGPPTKKQKTGQVKIEEPAAAATTEETTTDDTTTRPPYVPSFMPAFPQSLQSGRSMIVDIPDVSLLSSDHHNHDEQKQNVAGVRSSLVDLGQSYWGSGWDDEQHKVKAGKAAAAAVPTTTKTTAAVTPLSRPSVARVSRILEGSMDGGA